MTIENTVAQWTEEFRSVRQRTLDGGGKPGFASLDQLARLTGLQFMQGMLAGSQPYPHIAETLDFGLLDVEFGKAVFQGTPQLKHYNPIGSVHGGWYATLLDSALGCAVQTTLPVGRAYTTVELGINLVRGATHKTGPLRAIGTTVHSGRQLATAEARIVGPDGRLYAHGTTTCMVFELPARTG